jgi:hypothetical protein
VLRGAVGPSQVSGGAAPAAEWGRVCQARHRAHGVEVPVPGMRGAAGEAQGQGVSAR